MQVLIDTQLCSFIVLLAAVAKFTSPLLSFFLYIYIFSREPTVQWPGEPSVNVEEVPELKSRRIAYRHLTPSTDLSGSVAAHSSQRKVSRPANMQR